MSINDYSFKYIGAMYCLTLFRRAFSGLLTDGGEGAEKPPSLKSVTHILQ